ncbi:DUF5693 family protein [Paenibacillus chitinolyticus]|nr:DUF5693 family protein [Paenibacillus chitinolyticus]
MVHRYTAANRMLRKLLWWLVIIGLLASLPLAFFREQTEKSANQVEFVFDYRDLLEMADVRPNPQGFVSEQLQAMKKAGIGSLAVYESTLSELRLSRRIEVFSSKDATSLTQKPISPNENFTYILFTDPASESQIKPMIETAFNKLGVKTSPWSFKNQAGMIIEMNMEEANMKPMDPDPITLQMMKDEGFRIVVRLGNKREFVTNEMDALLAKLYKLGARRIIIDGDYAPGYSDDPEQVTLHKMGILLKKYDMGLANIEMLKQPQKGFGSLAKDTDYNVVRLHSFTEKDGEKLTENLTKEDQEARIQQTADRFVLAVKDRNIRMLFLNGRAVKNLDKAAILTPLDSLYESLNGKDGAIKRIEDAGFKVGPAKQFDYTYNTYQNVARFFTLIGGVSLIVLLVGYFIPEAVLALFIIGLLGAAGLFFKSPDLYAQGLALACAISAPSIAVIEAIRSIQSGRAAKAKSAVLYALGLLIKTTLISLIGVVYLVGLLNHISYFLVLQQFRGVSLLHLLPIALVGLYLLFFRETLNYRERGERVKKLLSTNISVLWIIAAAAAAGVIYYYLSRTGNEGQTSAIERYLRSFLENTLGVRPRNKEFMLAHPLFLLGAYLSVKYRNAVYLLLIGVVGQLSIVDTFAHLHTPLEISGIRITYGIVFGAMIGLVLIAVWEIASRSWKAWVAKSRTRVNG